MTIDVVSEVVLSSTKAVCEQFLRHKICKIEFTTFSYPGLIWQLGPTCAFFVNSSDYNEI